MIEALTAAQEALLASIVNTCGTGQHPYADANNLAEFKIDYLRGCVTRALAEASDEALAEVRELAEAIGVPL